MSTSSLDPNGSRRSLLAAFASAILPGLGQLLRGRLVEAGLFLFAMLWLRGFLAGHAEPSERVAAFLFGAPAISGGLRTPVLVVFTALLAGLHVLSAWGAYTAHRATRPTDAPEGVVPAAEEKGSGEV